MPRFYLDLRRHRDAMADGETPWTPAIAVAFQVDEGIRLMNEEGQAGRLRAPRRVRRRDPGRPRGARLPALRRAGQPLEDRDGRVDPRRASTGRRSTATLKRRGARPRRRPGQAHRQGLPGRPPRLGDGRRDRRRDRDARGGLDRRGAATSSAGVARPRPREASGGGGRAPAGLTDHALAPPVDGRAGARLRVLVAEAIAPEGVEALRAQATRSTSGPACTADDAARGRRRLRRADRPQPGRGRRGADRGRRRGSRSSGAPASASTTSTSTRPRAPGSPSSTRRPATRSPPRSTRSRCSSRSRGASPRPTPRSAAASGRAARSRACSCAAGRSGIIGLGKIGMAVAERARGPRDDAPRQRPVRHRRAGRAARRRARDLDALLERSDAVTVHVPLTRATTGLIDAKAIARMKPGAFVLNVARGGIVDEAALADGAARGPPRRRRDRRLRERAADRLAAARRAEHGPHAAPRRLDRGGPGRRRRGDRRAGARRARRPAGALRRQRAAALRRGRADDRAVPAARRDARPVPRPVRARRRRRRSRSSWPASWRGPNPRR